MGVVTSLQTKTGVINCDKSILCDNLQQRDNYLFSYSWNLLHSAKSKEMRGGN